MRPPDVFIAIVAMCLCAVRIHAADYTMICPAHLHSTSLLPLVVAVPNPQYGFDRTVFDSLHFDNPGLDRTALAVRRGAGTLLSSVQTPGTTVLRLPVGNGDTLRHTLLVEPNYPALEYSGTLAEGAYAWDSSVDRVITGDLVIPEGAEVYISAGTLIRLHKHASIIVRGRLEISGTPEKPVLFLPEKAGQPWGSLVFEGTQSLIANCIFSGGGGNTERAFGHSGSQPVLYADRSRVNLYSSYFVYNPGKAFGSVRSNLLMNNVLISHCDTGGEFYGSTIEIDKSLIMDIPDGDGSADDDDNDGFYFAGVKEDEPEAYTMLSNSTISLTEDDCIDHNGARIQVRNCILERARHEGLAASNGHTAIVVNSLVQECQQGIESGYGSPLVLVDHCVIVNNDTGLRFGDSYDEPSAGSLRATNTVIYNNGDNILNFDPQLNGPLPGALSVAYCMANDPDFDDSTGCITGIPIFDTDTVLADLSPGFRSGMAGSSMGLFRSGAEFISITELFSDSPAGGSGDWIEIHNSFPFPFALSQWKLRKGDAVFTLPPATVIPAHGYIVVCRDSSVFRTRYSHPVHLIGNLPFDLGHTGPVVLEAPPDTVIESIPYTDGAPWPERSPDKSIVLLDPFLDNSRGEHWIADPVPGGTPGYHRYGATVDIPGKSDREIALHIAPQPFGSRCSVSFSTLRAGRVELLAYNTVGLHVRTLFCGHTAGGHHTIPFDTHGLPAGALYFALKIDGEIIGFTGGIHNQND